MFNDMNLKLNIIKEYSIIPFSNYMPKFEKSENIISINSNKIAKSIDNAGWYGISSFPIISKSCYPKRCCYRLLRIKSCSEAYLRLKFQ